MPRKPVAAAVAVLSIALLLTACGGGDAEDEPEQVDDCPAQAATPPGMKTIPVAPCGKTTR